MRLADPPPGFCSACFGAAPERRFIDFQADYDGAPVLDRETGTIAVMPWSGELGGHDNLYLCENCVRTAAELLAEKPKLTSALKQENQRTVLQRDHWRDAAASKDAELEKQAAYIAKLEAQVDAAALAAPRKRERVAA